MNDQAGVTNDQRKAKPPRRRTLRNTVFSLLGKFQAAVFSYIVIRLLLDVLTVEEYGLYSLLFIGVMINFSMISQFGIPHLITRFVPELFSSNNWRGIREIFGKVFRTQVAVGIVLLVIVYFLAPKICEWINFPGEAEVLRIFSVAALLYLLSEVYHFLFSATFRQSTIFTVTIVYNTVRLLLLGGVYLAYRSFVAVVVAESASLAICVTLYAVARAKDKVHEQAATSDEPVSWPRMKKYASLAYANEIGVALLSVATDFFLVSSILGGVATGFYGLANRINDLAQKALPMKMLGPVIQPLFFSEYGASKEKAEFGFRLLMKATLFPTVAVAIWMVVMSKEVIVYLFDPRYAEAWPLVATMALFLPSASLRMPLGLMLQNHERIDILIWAKATGLLKIVAGVLLLPRYGYVVMPWITGFAVLAQNNFVYFFVKKVANARADFWGNVRIWLNGAAAGVVIYFLRPYLNSLLGVIASIAIYSVLFLIFSMINRGFSKEERDFINSKLPKPLWKF
ncbi:MAG: oligosaccharide flippase family protein [Calditrichaeota bacterium]|nr:oligosaccharide flippase family protein [Calditrichota bacterium]MCB9369405.1 oligosaccharide flippase family protein [Calditrichota bacterium]